MMYHKSVERLYVLLKHFFHNIILGIEFICWLLPTSLPNLMTLGPCAL